MAVRFQSDIIKELSEKYPHFTVRSIRKLVDYGIRHIFMELRKDENIFISGKTKNGKWDGFFIFEDIDVYAYAKKMNRRRLKKMNRERVEKFKNKSNGEETSK